MAASSTRAQESILQGTLHDLHVRSIVDETLQDVLIDVELAAGLHKELAGRSQQAALEFKINEKEQALEELRAWDVQKTQHRRSLADELVKDLWNLSRDLGDLHQWKQTHERKLGECEDLATKLRQAEEKIRELEARSNDVGAPAALADPVSNRAVSSNDSERGDDDDEDKGDTSQGIDTPRTSTSQVEVAEEISTSIVESTSQSNPVQVDQHEELDQDIALVTLLEDDDDDIPTFDTLSMAVMNHIFEYLDALDILSTAQVNVTMYSRVDALFGLGHAIDVSDVSDGTVVELPPPIVTVVEPPPRVALEPIKQPNPVPATSANTATTSATPRAPQPVSVPASAPSPTLPPLRSGGIFSLLQSRVGNRKRTAVPEHSQPLSAAMANSMAAKLTDAELGAIISMTEKLHQRESDVIRLVNEKDDLAGKLAGTESLKDFLVQKVREVEQALSKSQADENKVTQQIASDQEVIAFLDGRVQELERNVTSLTQEKQKTMDELTRVQVLHNRKITVLSDMLQFEREHIAENEREWKATKRLLVKEIKSCRSLLMALQAERDGLREQNEQLKRALLATNTASNGA